jgi:error-prone DNA polymerase
MVRAWVPAVSAYAELVALSNFSFLEGASHPEELVIQAKAIGLESIAICDRNSLAGIVRAHGQAKKDGIRFITGCRLVLMGGVEIACLPTDRAAYGRLSQLLTSGNRRAPKAQCFLWLDDVLRFGEGQIFIALPSPRPRTGAGIHEHRAISSEEVSPCHLSRGRAPDRRARRQAISQSLDACRRHRRANGHGRRMPLSPCRPTPLAGCTHLHPRKIHA